jgi:hypothetical protein
MSDATVCNQKHCGAPADYRFTWPGQDEAGICQLHSDKLLWVSKAMGLQLQLIPT